MKLRWLRQPDTSTAPDVLQEWVPGWGIEVIDGEHGYWRDVPIAIAEAMRKSDAETVVTKPG